MPEVDPKSSSHRFGIQQTSNVKAVGDVYENEEHVPDISIDQIKHAIDEKSKDKNAGFNKEYSVSHKQGINNAYIFFNFANHTFLHLILQI